jgi:hypothetical protein
MPHIAPAYVSEGYSIAILALDKGIMAGKYRAPHLKA